MSAMSTDEQDRASLKYTGDRVVTIGGDANAVPALIRPGDVVEVNTSAVEALIASGEFTVEGAAPPELRGEQLDDALRDAGLPLTGTADEKRQRLAEHNAGNNDPGQE